MQTVKSCELDDSLRHVCFKDLEQYWRKDEYFSNLSDLEKDIIRLNLNLTKEQLIDNLLSRISKNPIENKVVTYALDKKLDLDKVAKVALTGEYSDLKHAPCSLPNPYGIVINGNYYDGEKPLEITIDKVSLLENDKNYATKEEVQEQSGIQGILVNRVVLPSDCDKYVHINIPTKASDLQQDVISREEFDALVARVTQLEQND